MEKDEEKHSLPTDEHKNSKTSRNFTKKWKGYAFFVFLIISIFFALLLAYYETTNADNFVGNFINLVLPVPNATNNITGNNTVSEY